MSWKKSLVIKACREGKTIGQVCRELNISKTQARDWLLGMNMKEGAPEYYAHLDTPEVRGKPKDSIVLAIPDLHCPFEHPDALAFLKAVKSKFVPTTIVCLGDEMDGHAFSRYMPDPDGDGPGQELARSIEHLIPFYKEFPEVLVCESNHTIRGWKKGFDAGLPQSFLRTVETVLEAPDGWRWASHHEIDGVFYTHGDPFHGVNADRKWRQEKNQSVVIGHIHAHAGVKYHGSLFSANMGCLIDDEAYAFKYARKMPVRVNLGCGLIINGQVAHFIPMRVNNENRWIGRL